MQSIIGSIKLFFDTRVLSYINTLLAYPIKIVVLLVDLLLVGYLVYMLVKMVKDTRAIQLIKGIAVLIAITALSEFFSLRILHYILSSVMTYGVLVLIVVFQPELRRALEQIGRTKFRSFFDFDDENNYIEEVIKVAQELSKNKIGALIAFERETPLGDYASTGIKLNANVSHELLINIFTPDTPLHDGGVVIKGNKILAAACIFPLTDNTNLDRELGTRHRAAIGLTEQVDAVVMVVSEETGIVSIATNGKIIRNLTVEQLRRELTKRLDKNRKSYKIKNK